MASMLCGCGGKKSRHSGSSVYEVSANDELSLTSRPPTTTSSQPAAHAAAAAQRALHDYASPARPGALASDAGEGEHVERYVAGGHTAVTVSVRPQRHHHHHRQYRHGRGENGDHGDGDVPTRHLSNYETVLDEYLHAAIATQQHGISNHCGKVHAPTQCMRLV